MKNKLLRSELKNIVKECLVEILSEGLSAEAATPSVKTPQTSADRKNRLSEVATQDTARSQQADVEARHKNIANSLTDDPVLASVLAESHQTVASQIAAERAGMHAMAGDPAARAVAHNDPMEIFAESAGNWAQLAFSDSN